MNAAAALSLIASAIEIVIGALALSFAAAPGWKHFRTFSIVAFSAAAFGLGNVVFATPAVASDLIPWVGRSTLLFAFVHCASWVAYVRVQYDRALRPLDWVAIATLLGFGALALVPGLALDDRVRTQYVAWVDIAYRVPIVTGLGSLMILVIPLALLRPVVEYARQARQGAPRARTHLLGFSIFYVLALNEVLVTLQFIEGIYLVDLGFLAAVLSVSAEMTNRVTGDARRLQELSTRLSRDVDDRTRELTKARDDLIHAERLAALGRLSASIGHEINNPLSYVLGNLEFSAGELERAGGSAPVMDALRDATSGADRIRRIVHELRAFGRSPDGNRHELVDVREVLEEAIKIVGAPLQGRTRLVRELLPVPEVSADPVRLTQVFVNLLLNAAQAIPDSRGDSARGEIKLRAASRSDGGVAVEIIDNGMGIPKANLTRVFEPFFSTKAQDEGNGLGLFVSLGIVTALGGQIEVESQVGEGTTVRVLLPRAAQSISPTPPHVSSVPPPVRVCRLLVIDDDALVARTLARLLKRHEVHVVTSGREALARLAEDGDNFDLVLCDLMMPDTTGMDVYEQVAQSLPALAERFVFISGGGITERSRAFLAEHADRVLPKPIDGRLLAGFLAKLSAGISETPPRVASAESDCSRAQVS